MDNKHKKGKLWEENGFDNQSYKTLCVINLYHVTLFIPKHSSLSSLTFHTSYLHYLPRFIRRLFINFYFYVVM